MCSSTICFAKTQFCTVSTAQYTMVWYKFSIWFNVWFSADTCVAGILIILWHQSSTQRLHAFIYMQHAEAALLCRLRWSHVIATLYSMFQSSVMSKGKWLGPVWCLALNLCQSFECFNFSPCSVAYLNLLLMPYADVLLCVHGLLGFSVTSA